MLPRPTRSTLFPYTTLFRSNLKTNPPKVAGICDVTGEKLVHRDDDKEDVIRERMKVFESTLNPMLDFYKTKGILAEVDADKGVDRKSTRLNSSHVKISYAVF